MHGGVYQSIGLWFHHVDGPGKNCFGLERDRKESERAILFRCRHKEEYLEASGIRLSDHTCKYIMEEH